MTEKQSNPPAKEELIDSNQTQFSVEEPLLEKPVSSSMEELKPSDSKKTKSQEEQGAQGVKPVSKNKKMLLGAGIFLVVVLLLLGILSIFRKPEIQLQEEVVEIIEEIEQKTQIEEKLLLIEEDLDKANPASQNMPFPPIDLELKID